MAGTQSKAFGRLDLPEGAMSPLEPAFLVNIGAVFRRDFRVFLDLHGASWKEHKRLLDSAFVVQDPDRHMYGVVREFCEARR